MRYYYCSNCKAVLNYQFGFNPRYGTWTCTECGQYNMDDSVYYGNRFEGVAWFCENCGCLLNKQRDFDDSFYTYTCEECGYINDIDEDHIDYSRDVMSFDSNGKYFDYDDDYNENYDDDYNENYDDDYNENYDDDYNENYDDDYDENYDDDEDDSDDYYVDNNSYSDRNSNSNYNDGTPSLRQIKRHLFFKRLGATIFHRKRIELSISTRDMLGCNVDDIVQRLTYIGFTNITTKPVYDLYINSKANVHEVDTISIAGKTDLFRGEEVKYNAPIVITYHKKRLIEFPYSNNRIKHLNYIDAFKTLNQLGFTNIQPGKKIRRHLGFGKKDGDVESFDVSGLSKVSSGTIIDFDTRIVINYISKLK